MRGARQDLQDSKGRTALFVAAFWGHAGVVELLCAAPGAPLDAQVASDGSTPLIRACWGGHRGVEGVVRALLARGARQELQDSSGHTALHNAAMCGRAGIVKLLCAASGAAAALAQRNSISRTPLTCAEMNSHYDIAAVMRAHGAGR